MGPERPDNDPHRSLQVIVKVQQSYRSFSLFHVHIYLQASSRIVPDDNILSIQYRYKLLRPYSSPVTELSIIDRCQMQVASGSGKPPHTQSLIAPYRVGTIDMVSTICEQISSPFFAVCGVTGIDQMSDARGAKEREAAHTHSHCHSLHSPRYCYGIKGMLFCDETNKSLEKVSRGYSPLPYV
jgi:hypothetical protein